MNIEVDMKKTNLNKNCNMTQKKINKILQTLNKSVPNYRFVYQDLQSSLKHLFI